MRYDGPVQTCQVGIVLAGGQSRRMGQDKALLPLGGPTLLERQAAKLAPLVHEVVVSGDAASYGRFGFSVVADPPGAQGPLGGIAAGLGRGDGLVLAVDLPFVPASFLARLVEVAGPDGALVDAPGLFQPTAAFYRGKALSVAREQLERGADLSLRGFVARLDVRRLSASEVREFGDPERMFLNVNDEKAYAMAVAWSATDPSRVPEA